MTEDPEKIKKIENSPFFRNGIIKIAGEIPTEPVVAEVEPAVAEVEEEKTGSKADNVVLDQGALDKALADIKANEAKPEDVTSEPKLVESKPVINTTIEQKSQAQGMQPRQTPRAVEWAEMTALAKEKGIPTTGKGVNRVYLSKALSLHQIFVQ